jgi:2-oxoisovalerate dehydrogenase E1 component
MDRGLTARILFTMTLINRFEHALLELKNADCVWGPVHTSIGQEAVAAAPVAALRDDDLIAGSHRAHHQFLSKVLYHAVGPGWNPLEAALPEAGREAVRRTMAEIMGLAPGYCGGRGGSMHLRCPEAGVLGTNAIVGGGIPLATGAAFAQKRLGTGRVVVCFFGDGAVNQGSFHEALNLAGLWKLPILYFTENNHYAVGTRAEASAAVSQLSVRAGSYAMPALVVEGWDVPALYAAMTAAVERVRGGEGPFLVEALCYRHYHHAGDRPGSAYGYRDKEEEARYLENDALKLLTAQAQELGLIDEAGVEALQRAAGQAVAEAVGFCTETTPGGATAVAAKPAVKAALWPDPATVTEGLRSSGRELEGLSYRAPEDYPQSREMMYSDAIAAVTGRWLERDPAVYVLGEEVANFGGGAYGATKELPRRFPERVLNTPISEAGFVGLACGSAMAGLKPVVEIMFPDFALVAADQVFNQIGKARHMYGGTTDLPLVARTRIATGCGYGGQHSMDPTGLFALFPGWRLVAPSNAFDYIGLFNTAMHSLDPVLFLEHHSMYTKKYPVPAEDLDYCVPFGRAAVAAAGEDITVLAYGAMTGRLLSLRRELERRGVSAEIVDLRTVDLPGIDYETIRVSLARTGVVAVVEEAAQWQGIGESLAAEITARFFDLLDGPPGCIASLPVPPPVSRALERAALVDDQRILAVLERMAKRSWR